MYGEKKKAQDLHFLSKQFSDSVLSFVSDYNINWPKLKTATSWLKGQSQQILGYILGSMTLNQFLMYVRLLIVFLNLSIMYFLWHLTISFNAASMKTFTNYSNFPESRGCSNAESLLSSRIQTATCVVKQQFPKATRTYTNVFPKAPAVTIFAQISSQTF